MAEPLFPTPNDPAAKAVWQAMRDAESRIAQQIGIENQRRRKMGQEPLPEHKSDPKALLAALQQAVGDDPEGARLLGEVGKQFDAEDQYHKKMLAYNPERGAIGTALDEAVNVGTGFVESAIPFVGEPLMRGLTKLSGAIQGKPNDYHAFKETAASDARSKLGDTVAGDAALSIAEGAAHILGYAANPMSKVLGGFGAKSKIAGKLLKQGTAWGSYEAATKAVSKITGYDDPVSLPQAFLGGVLMGAGSTIFAPLGHRITKALSPQDRIAPGVASYIREALGQAAARGVGGAVEFAGFGLMPDAHTGEIAPAWKRAFQDGDYTELMTHALTGAVVKLAGGKWGKMSPDSRQAFRAAVRDTVTENKRTLKQVADQVKGALDPTDTKAIEIAKKSTYRPDYTLNRPDDPALSPVGRQEGPGYGVDIFRLPGGEFVLRPDNGDTHVVTQQESGLWRHLNDTIGVQPSLPSERVALAGSVPSPGGPTVYGHGVPPPAPKPAPMAAPSAGTIDLSGAPPKLTPGGGTPPPRTLADAVRLKKDAELEAAATAQATATQKSAEATTDAPGQTLLFPDLEAAKISPTPLPAESVGRSPSERFSAVREHRNEIQVAWEKLKVAEKLDKDDVETFNEMVEMYGSIVAGLPASERGGWAKTAEKWKAKAAKLARRASGKAPEAEAKKPAPAAEKPSEAAETAKPSAESAEAVKAGKPKSIEVLAGSGDPTKNKKGGSTVWRMSVPGEGVYVFHHQPLSKKLVLKRFIPEEGAGVATRDAKGSLAFAEAVAAAATKAGVGEVTNVQANPAPHLPGWTAKMRLKGRAEGRGAAARPEQSPTPETARKEPARVKAPNLGVGRKGFTLQGPDREAVGAEPLRATPRYDAKGEPAPGVVKEGNRFKYVSRHGQVLGWAEVNDANQITRVVIGVEDRAPTIGSDGKPNKGFKHRTQILNAIKSSLWGLSPGAPAEKYANLKAPEISKDAALSDADRAALATAPTHWTVRKAVAGAKSAANKLDFYEAEFHRTSDPAIKHRAATNFASTRASGSGLPPLTEAQQKILDFAATPAPAPAAAPVPAGAAVPTLRGNRKANVTKTFVENAAALLAEPTFDAKKAARLVAHYEKRKSEGYIDEGAAAQALAGLRAKLGSPAPAPAPAPAAAPAAAAPEAAADSLKDLIANLDTQINALPPGHPVRASIEQAKERLLKGPTGAPADEVGALRAENRSLLNEAYTDPLTKLRNANAWQKILANVPQNAPGRKWFVIDLNRFKAVNDAEGHAAGDAILSDIGAKLGAEAERLGMSRNVSRLADAQKEGVTRSGGDEFAGYGTEAQVEALHAFAKTLTSTSPGGREVTASFGSGDTYKAADTAMYTEKAARHKAIDEAAERAKKASEVRAEKAATRAESDYIDVPVSSPSRETWVRPPQTDTEANSVLDGYQATLDQLSYWRTAHRNSQASIDTAKRRLAENTDPERAQELADHVADAERRAVKAEQMVRDLPTEVDAQRRAAAAAGYPLEGIEGLLQERGRIQSEIEGATASMRQQLDALMEPNARRAMNPDGTMISRDVFQQAKQTRLDVQRLREVRGKLFAQLKDVRNQLRELGWRGERWADVEDVTANWANVGPEQIVSLRSAAEVSAARLPAYKHNLDVARRTGDKDNITRYEIAIDDAKQAIKVWEMAEERMKSMRVDADEIETWLGENLAAYKENVAELRTLRGAAGDSPTEEQRAAIASVQRRVAQYIDRSGRLKELQGKLAQYNNPLTRVDETRHETVRDQLQRMIDTMEGQVVGGRRRNVNAAGVNVRTNPLEVPDARDIQLLKDILKATSGMADIPISSVLVPKRGALVRVNVGGMEVEGVVLDPLLPHDYRAWDIQADLRPVQGLGERIDVLKGRVEGLEATVSDRKQPMSTRDKARKELKEARRELVEAAAERNVYRHSTTEPGRRIRILTLDGRVVRGRVSDLVSSKDLGDLRGKLAEAGPRGIEMSQEDFVNLFRGVGDVRDLDYDAYPERPIPHEVVARTKELESKLTSGKIDREEARLLHLLSRKTGAYYHNRLNAIMHDNNAPADGAWSLEPKDIVRYLPDERVLVRLPNGEEANLHVGQLTSMPDGKYKVYFQSTLRPELRADWDAATAGRFHANRISEDAMRLAGAGFALDATGKGLEAGPPDSVAVVEFLRRAEDGSMHPLDAAETKDGTAVLLRHKETGQILIAQRMPFGPKDYTWRMRLALPHELPDALQRGGFWRNVYNQTFAAAKPWIDAEIRRVMGDDGVYLSSNGAGYIERLLNRSNDKRTAARLLRTNHAPDRVHEGRPVSKTNGIPHEAGELHGDALDAVLQRTVYPLLVNPGEVIAPHLPESVRTSRVWRGYLDAVGKFKRLFFEERSGEFTGPSDSLRQHLSNDRARTNATDRRIGETLGRLRELPREEQEQILRAVFEGKDLGREDLKQYLADTTADYDFGTANGLNDGKSRFRGRWVHLGIWSMKTSQVQERIAALEQALESARSPNGRGLEPGELARIVRKVNVYRELLRKHWGSDKTSTYEASPEDIDTWENGTVERAKKAMGHYRHFETLDQAISAGLDMSDPIAHLENSMMMSARARNRVLLYNSLAKDKEVARSALEGPVPEGWVRATDMTSNDPNGWGELGHPGNHYFVHPQVADALVASQGTAGPLGRVWDTVHGIYKASATLANPANWVTQELGNAMTMLAQGVPLWRIPAFKARGWKAVTDRSGEDWDKYHQVWESRDWFSSGRDELREIDLRLRGNRRIKLEGKRVRRGLFGQKGLGEMESTHGDTYEKAAGALRKVTGAYRSLDASARVAMFLYHIDRGLTPEQAAVKVDRYWNLTDVPRGVKAIRRAPMGSSFFSISYALARNYKELLRNSPKTFVQLAALSALAGVAAKQFFKLDDEEYQAQKDASLPYVSDNPFVGWLDRMTALPVPTANGLAFLSLRRWLPYDPAANIALGAIPGFKSPTLSPARSLMHTAAGAQNILTGPAMEWAFDQDLYYGGSISQRQGGFGRHVLQSYLPFSLYKTLGGLGRAAGLTIPGIETTRDVTPSGKPEDPFTRGLRDFLGVQLQQPSTTRRQLERTWDPGLLARGKYEEIRPSIVRAGGPRYQEARKLRADRAMVIAQERGLKILARLALLEAGDLRQADQIRSQLNSRTVYDQTIRALALAGRHDLLNALVQKLGHHNARHKLIPLPPLPITPSKEDFTELQP